MTCHAFAKQRALLLVILSMAAGQGHGTNSLGLDLTLDHALSLLNEQPAPPPRPDGDDVHMVATSERTWRGLVHGIPMQFSRPPDALVRELPTHFLEWLVLDRAPGWRRLPADERWLPANERATLTAKYRRYNMLREALADDDERVASTARGLRRFLRQEWANMTSGFTDVRSRHRQFTPAPCAYTQLPSSLCSRSSRR